MASQSALEQEQIYTVELPPAANEQARRVQPARGGKHDEAALWSIPERASSEAHSAEANIRRQMGRISALRAIDQALVSTFDLHVTLNVVLDQAIEQLQVTAATILLRRPGTQTLDYQILRGIYKKSLRAASLRIGEGFAGQVALERRVLHLADLLDLPNTQPPFDGLMAAYYAAPLIVKGQVEGVLEVIHTSSLQPDAEWLDFFETIAGQAAVAIDHATMFNAMQRAHAELSQAYTTTLEGWARALELRDNETEGHAQRVTELTVALARAMGMSEAEIVHIRRGALLHDIGKMGIPDSVLLKPGPLSDEEWAIMRRHPDYARRLLEPIAYLRPALDIPLCHHERWDGTGYPRGLSGEDIPLAARIFTVVDVWDALRFDRPYRAGWPDQTVREYLQAGAGTHFDPEVVEAFLQLEANQASIDDERLTVLVVDDEDGLTLVLRRVLKDNYTILTAKSGQEALSILEREPIAVLITDQRMPGMTGVQLLEHTRYISPQTLGILTSGYFDNGALSDALNVGNVRGYIQKPWSIPELRRRVNEVARQYVPKGARR